MNNNESVEKEIKKIEDRIFDSCKEGGTAIYVSGDISSCALSHFEEKGYKIAQNKTNISQDRVITSTIIRW